MIRVLLVLSLVLAGCSEPIETPSPAPSKQKEETTNAVYLFHGDYRVVEANEVIGCVVVGYGETQPVMVVGLNGIKDKWYKGPLHLKPSSPSYGGAPYTDANGVEKTMPVYTIVSQ